MHTLYAIVLINSYFIIIYIQRCLFCNDWVSGRLTKKLIDRRTDGQGAILMKFSLVSFCTSCKSVGAGRYTKYSCSRLRNLIKSGYDAGSIQGSPARDYDLDPKCARCSLRVFVAALAAVNRLTWFR